MNEPTYTKVLFQGSKGSYSHLACTEVFPHLKATGCTTFNDVFHAIDSDPSAVALLPVENSIAGRVAEVHQLLVHNNLYIIKEHYQPVEHYLLIHPESSIEEITTVKSHTQALYQCQSFLKKKQWKQIAVSDTALAAQEVGERQQRDCAAIASTAAADIYNLTIAEKNIADTNNNITRFIALYKECVLPPIDTPSITSIIFQAQNKPSSLYHALGVFAEQSINLTRLEGIVLPNDHFNQAQFYIDIEGHTQSQTLQNALKKLKNFSENIRILGCYPADTFRTSLILSLYAITLLDSRCRTLPVGRANLLMKKEKR